MAYNLIQYSNPQAYDTYGNVSFMLTGILFDAIATGTTLATAKWIWSSYKGDEKPTYRRSDIPLSALLFLVLYLFNAVPHV